jgi:hypothetical protein
MSVTGLPEKIIVQVGLITDGVGTATVEVDPFDQPSLVDTLPGTLKFG